LKRTDEVIFKGIQMISPEKNTTHQQAFDRQIESSQNECQKRYHMFFRARSGVSLSGWFARLMETRIIPSLTRIGFEEDFAREIFKIAASSWQLMGPAADENLRFLPIPLKEIAEIRKGLLRKAELSRPKVSSTIRQNPNNTISQIEKEMAPENLFSLLESVSTPWIILPRAYAHLQIYHCRYLPIYLRYLEAETRPEFLNILLRVCIEFIVNYSLKYMDNHYPRNDMIKALVFGYSAMFWKTLSSPPENFEDNLIFIHFFRWAKAARNRFPHHRIL